MTAQEIRASHAFAANGLDLGQPERALATRNGEALFRVAFQHLARPAVSGNRLGGVYLEPRARERGQRDRPRG